MILWWCALLLLIEAQKTQYFNNIHQTQQNSGREVLAGWQIDTKNWYAQSEFAYIINLQLFIYWKTALVIYQTKDDLYIRAISLSKRFIFDILRGRLGGEKDSLQWDFVARLLKSCMKINTKPLHCQSYSKKLWRRQKRIRIIFASHPKYLQERKTHVSLNS